jgi:hypothetical protein
MENVYLICAVAGGTVLVLQTLLAALGGFAEVDHGGDDALETITDAHDAFLKLLSFKTVVAFATFFGLTGLAADRAGWPATTTLGTAIAAGLLALWIVAWLMQALTRLQSRGNLDLQHAIGRPGRVYLTVPGQLAGPGKIQLQLQERTVETIAVTRGPELITGADVIVVGLRGETLEVEAAHRPAGNPGPQ